MALRTLNKTLDGTTQQVTTTHTPVRLVIVYNVTGNTAVLVGDKTLTAVIYGFSVAAASAGPPIGPFSGSLPFNLEELYVRGANAEIVRILYVT